MRQLFNSLRSAVQTVWKSMWAVIMPWHLTSGLRKMRKRRQRLRSMLSQPGSWSLNLLKQIIHHDISKRKAFMNSLPLPVFTSNKSIHEVRWCVRAAAPTLYIPSLKGDILHPFLLFDTIFYGHIPMYEDGFGQNTCWFKHSGPSLTPIWTRLFGGAESEKVLRAAVS